VLTNDRGHAGVVGSRIGPVRIYDVGIVLVPESDFAIIAKGRATAMNPHGKIIGAGTVGVRGARVWVQRESIDCLVRLSEATICLTVGSLGNEKDFLYPGGTPIGGIRNLPTFSETCFGAAHGNFGGSIAKTAPPLISGSKKLSQV
jgi:hypothetical protein